MANRIRSCWRKVRRDPVRTPQCGHPDFSAPTETRRGRRAPASSRRYRRSEAVAALTRSLRVISEPQVSAVKTARVTYQPRRHMNSSAFLTMAIRLKLWTERLEGHGCEATQGAAVGLLVATFVDAATDGLIIGAGITAGGETGKLLVLGLPVELLCLGLAVMSDRIVGWRIVGFTAALGGNRSWFCRARQRVAHGGRRLPLLRKRCRSAPWHCPTR